MIFTPINRPRVRNFIYVSDNSTHVVEHCCRAPAVNIADASYAKVLCATLAAPLRIHQLQPVSFCGPLLFATCLSQSTEGGLNGTVTYRAMLKAGSCTQCSAKSHSQISLARVAVGTGAAGAAYTRNRD